MKTKALIFALTLALLASACGSDAEEAGTKAVGDDVIAAQRAALALVTDGAGPQAPRDIASATGTNPVSFPVAPAASSMNLCNIHFHESAEHKGGEYTTYDGNGDGKGHGTGYVYNGNLSDAELKSFDAEVGKNEYGELVPGDTIEIHYVHSTDPITPGPTLGACLASDTSAPLLQVQAQVYVLVNDDSAADFGQLTEVAQVDGFYQAVNMPTNLGTVVQYAGSTTGPKYNEEPSPLKVTWNVHPNVLKVDIATVAQWLEDNPFEEDYAHAVRNLVTNPALLSPIG